MPSAVAPSPVSANVAVYRLNVDEPAPEQPSMAVDEREWIEPLLHQNAIWFCQLRWIVVAVLGLAALSSFVPRQLAMAGLRIQPAYPLAAAAILGALNLAFTRAARAFSPDSKGWPIRSQLWTQIISDLLVLTGVIHWLGAGIAAAPFMYLFHIILACVVFTPGESLTVAGLAALFYLTAQAMTAFGLVDGHSVLVGAPSAGSGLSGAATRGLNIPSMLLIWAVIWYLVSRLASAVRSRDRELFLSNRRLRASIEERSQHMLQTTHQLKAPFAAIHALTQLLLGDYCGKLPDPARATVEKISARCLVLARQIQEMLQLANLRSQGQTPPPRQAVNLAHLVETVLARLEPAARQRGVRFEKDVQPVVVDVVEDHLTMLVDNVVVNAVNYSFDNGVVEVLCQRWNTREALVVVRDRGIGIPREKLPRIFDDYYRTEEAVQHNRGSTGLGLAIVRQVASKDHWPITVESAPGWGTRMTLILPLSGARATISSPNSNN